MTKIFSRTHGSMHFAKTTKNGANELKYFHSIKNLPGELNYKLNIKYLPGELFLLVETR
jgi:hypothetical protein